MYEITSREIPEQKTLVRRAKVHGDAISEFIGETYSAVAMAVQGGGLSFAGPPFGRYRPLDDGSEFEIEAGFPVNGEGAPAGDVEVSSLPAGRVAVAVHFGPYDAMMPAYQAVLTWLTDNGHSPDGPAWEVYYSDPEEQPDPATWRTEICQPYT